MAIREVMQRADAVRSGMALGGIGAGTMELCKDGVFYHWNIANSQPLFTGRPLQGEAAPNAPKPFTDRNLLFFIVRYQIAGDRPRFKLLQIENGDELAAMEEQTYTFPWMPGVEQIATEYSFPFTRMTFTDPEMPLVVELEAFTPFIPHDVKNSALPAVIFNFTITATTDEEVDVMLMASARNIVGYDVQEKIYRTHIAADSASTVVQMTCEMDDTHSSAGTLALAALSGDASYYAGWEYRHPYYELLMYNRTLGNIDDTDGRNMTDKKTGKVTAMARLFSTVGQSKIFTKRGERLQQTMLFTWHFPNLYGAKSDEGKHLEGHYYDNFFHNAGEVARYVRENLSDLTARTRGFQQHYFESTLPPVVLEQVSSNLNTLHSSTWLTKSGDFGVNEGMTAYYNRGPLATVDVGMYGSVMAAALFPELDKAAVLAHLRLQNPTTGSISHGIAQDFAHYDANEGVTDRLDLPSQYSVMALRTYCWTGDKAYLAQVWPSVQRALEYVLRERDMNHDLLPDMEGIMCSYDNFPMFGAAAYVASQWLAAVAYAAQAARAMGDSDAAKKYDDIYTQGCATFEAKLWNGSYYRLYNDIGGEKGDISEGCLTDQLLGQWAMHQAGLGYLVPPAHVKEALRSVMRMSFRDYGLINCKWPEDGYLHDYAHQGSIWVDQANTCWTGVELGFASLLVYEGLTDEALQVVDNVDSRYRKLNQYFDHKEFGGHYYRPLSCWMLINAYLGLYINLDHYTFAPRLPQVEQTLFFSYGHGTGHYQRQAVGNDNLITITNHDGLLTIGTLTLGLSATHFTKTTVNVDGETVDGSQYTANFDGAQVVISFKESISIAAGGTARVTVS